MYGVRCLELGEVHMKILVTGFEVFGGEQLNPSAEVLRLLPLRLDDIQIIKRILPVTVKNSMTAVTAAIKSIAEV